VIRSGATKTRSSFRFKGGKGGDLLSKKNMGAGKRRSHGRLDGSGYIEKKDPSKEREIATYKKKSEPLEKKASLAKRGNQKDGRRCANSDRRNGDSQRRWKKKAGERG